MKIVTPPAPPVDHDRGLTVHRPITFHLVMLMAGIAAHQVACAQFIPHDLEPARIRPQSTIKLPEIRTVPDAVDYLLEMPGFDEPPGKPYPIVHLRIPKAPYFEKNSSNGPARVYGVHLTMFYPDFSGLADLQNIECGARHRDAINYWGYCRRQLTVSMEFARKDYLQTSYAVFQHGVEHGYVTASNGESRYPDLDLVATSGRSDDALRRTYYLSKNPSDSDEKFLIQCSEFVLSPSCDVFFRSGKSPYLRISLTFVLALLPQFREVIERTRDKVNSMIVATYEVPR